jgi:hypothetical protein
MIHNESKYDLSTVRLVIFILDSFTYKVIVLYSIYWRNILEFVHTLKNLYLCVDHLILKTTIIMSLIYL